MTLPVLVVTGFLGAGKTTLINRMLSEADGHRIAAIVNDFGAINIDEALIAERTETVIGLANGCICCSLQGDLLRTLRQLVTHPRPVEHVIVEASGVADPGGIVEALTDPELWGHVRLNAVLAVADMHDLADNPQRFDDPLWRAQIEPADFVVLAKTGQVATPPLRDRLAAAARGVLLEPDTEPLPLAVLLDGDLVPNATRGGGTVDASARFVTLEWQTDQPGRLSPFQQAMEALAPQLVRAKGLLNFAEMPDRTLLFQMVGRRATLTPQAATQPGNRLVLIGERGTFDADAARWQIASAFPQHGASSTQHHARTAG